MRIMRVVVQAPLAWVRAAALSTRRKVVPTTAWRARASMRAMAAPTWWTARGSRRR